MRFFLQFNTNKAIFKNVVNQTFDKMATFNWLVTNTLQNIFIQPKEIQFNTQNDELGVKYPFKDTGLQQIPWTTLSLSIFYFNSNFSNEILNGDSPKADFVSFCSGTLWSSDTAVSAAESRGERGLLILSPAVYIDHSPRGGCGSPLCEPNQRGCSSRVSAKKHIHGWVNLRQAQTVTYHSSSSKLSKQIYLLIF